MELEQKEIVSKSVSKQLVNIVGTSLGNLIWRIYSGDFKQENKELLNYKNTNYFIIGGSIGTNGYTKTMLPLLSQKQIINLANTKDKAPKIIMHNFNSSNVGALGSYFAFTEEAKHKIKILNKQITKKNKIPLLALMDIGGTKINLVLALLNDEGELNYKILTNHIFVTCKYENPNEFYNQLAYNIKPIFDNYDTGIYEIIPILGLGQPGLLTNPKGTIIEGARDLGTTTTTFLNSNPSVLFTNSLSKLGYNMDVYVCNDGIAQFNGLLLGIKLEDQMKWQEICSHKQTKIMYLGIGTGLGSACGLVNSDGTYTIDSYRGAYKIKTKNSYENIEYSSEIEKYFNIINLPTKDYEYGEVLSSKFFRRYMHLMEYISLDKKRPPIFIPYAGLINIPNNLKQILIEGANQNSSLLNPIIINNILNDEIIKDKAEITVECSSDEIEINLDKILKNYAYEVGVTLIKNIKEKDYIKAVSEVVKANQGNNSIHFIGIGKSHSIGDNLSYKFCNLGFKSDCIELSGANSENLTNVREGDVVFLISNSGKSWELLNLIPYIKEKGCYTIAITGRIDSPLARNSDTAICSKVKDINNDIARLPEAPTTTTTSALAVGAAIGIVSAHYFNYTKDKFFLDHPNLIYDGVSFEGMIADEDFDISVKIKDIYTQLSKAINDMNKDEIYKQVMLILKKILASYYNKRTIYITGSGASLHVASKIASTMTSIGIDAEVVNPAQLPHGDFAHIVKGDLLIIITASGNTTSTRYVYDLATNKGIESVLITGNVDSYIAEQVYPNYIVVGNNVSDAKLISIPDQKILKSFLNLAIGDALAVLLAWLIKTTHIEFATLSHQGGAIARETITYEKYIEECKESNISLTKLLENKEAKQHFYQVLDNNLEEINKKMSIHNKYHLITQEMSNYNNRENTNSIMVFGLGSMGIAYVGRLLSLANKNLIYVESDQNKLKKFKNKRQFKLAYNESNTTYVNIKEILSSSMISDIASKLLEIDTVFVTIGVNNVLSLIDIIILTVLRRYAYNIQEPINFIFDENFELDDKTLDNLHYKIYIKLKNPNIKNYFNEFVGFVPAVSEAIVPEITEEDTILIEEEIPYMYIDNKEYKHNKNKKQFIHKNIIFEDNFKAIHMRKLWVHNMAHAFIAYLGIPFGYKTVYESINNPKIEKIVKIAMLEVSSVLYRRWDYSKTRHKTNTSYVNWCIKRYKNTFLNDTLDRVGRGIERKLRKNDRLIGPLNYIWKYDKIVSKEILLAIMAAIKCSDDYDKLYNHVIQNIEVNSNELIKIEEEYNKLFKGV